MEFEIGDSVRIREWDDMLSEFGLDHEGNIATAILNPFNKDMRKWCGCSGVVYGVTTRLVVVKSDDLDEKLVILNKNEIIRLNARQQVTSGNFF